MLSLAASLRFAAFLLVSAGCLTLASCATPPEKGQPHLPKHPPALPEVKFTTVDDGWPPGLAGASDVREVSWSEGPDTLTDDGVQLLRQEALQDQRVRTALGQRFAFISADEVEPPKRPGARVSSKDVRLTFFSYSNNTAVVVRVTDSHVTGVDSFKGYQPPEGLEEIAQATRMAREDPRLRDRLQGLEPAAIVTFLNPEIQGFGNRVLDVTFTRPGTFLPEFYALVDLTNQRVLRAGPLSERKGR